MNDQEVKASVDLRENLISANVTGVLSAKVERQSSSCCQKENLIIKSIQMNSRHVGFLDNYMHVISHDDINGA